MNIQLWIIIGIVAATILISASIVCIIKKANGLTFVNVALSLVTAVKTALCDAGVAESKFSDMLDLIIQALSYVQAICTDNEKTELKVEKALLYVKNIAGELDITLTDNETIIVSNVLALGFTFMDALGLCSKASFRKLYSRMAKYAGSSLETKAMGLSYIRR